MKTNTSELIDKPLDWAVAKCRGFNPLLEMQKGLPYSPSTHWTQGGEIIEQEEISIKHVVPAMRDSIWQAFPSLTAKGAGGKWGVGPTPLVAAMRCYVSSKLGDEVDIPKELLNV